MKFLYAHRTNSADGQYVHISELIDALRARDHEVDVAGPGGASAARKARLLDASEGEGGIRRLLPASLYEVAERAYSQWSYMRIARAIRRKSPDVIYERYNLHHHAGAVAARRFALPHILEVNAPLAEERSRHGKLKMTGLAERSERAVWTAADVVLPVSNVLADRMRAAGVKEERIHVIQNGVNEDFLRDHNGAAVREKYGLLNKTVLGFAGFVRPWHGLDRVIRFLATAEDPRVHLMIVGDGPARDALMALAVELDVSAKVTFAGVVQRADMPSHIAAFDIALQPAVVDYASPLKLFEYMALGRAIIAPKGANIQEVLRDGEDCVLFASESGALENAISRLARSEQQRKELGAAARASLVRQNLTWTGNARRVESIAEELVRARHDNSHRN